jgi:hypothetical protein
MLPLLTKWYLASLLPLGVMLQFMAIALFGLIMVLNSEGVVGGGSVGPKDRRASELRWLELPEDARDHLAGSAGDVTYWLAIWHRHDRRMKMLMAPPILLSVIGSALIAFAGIAILLIAFFDTRLSPLEVLAVLGIAAGVMLYAVGILYITIRISFWLRRLVRQQLGILYAVQACMNLVEVAASVNQSGALPQSTIENRRKLSWALSATAERLHEYVAGYLAVAADRRKGKPDLVKAAEAAGQELRRHQAQVLLAMNMRLTLST